MKHKNLKLSSISLILLFLFAQIGTAQHASVHFLEQTQIASHQHDDDNHGKKTDKACQICLSAKGFSHLMGTDAAPALLLVALDKNGIHSGADQQHQERQYSPYLPRGPPAFLI